VVVIVAACLAALAAFLTVRPPRRHSALRELAPTLISALRHRLFSRRRRTRVRGELRDTLAEVVADIRAGQPPDRALARALADRDGTIAPRTLAATRWGGDVADALRDDARGSSQPLLASAAACWSVASTQGAGLADSLDRLVTQDRRAEEVRRQLEAHLAAPRATARMLALLPALGLLLGIAVGGDPLGWLLGTGLGLACLVLGLLLVAAGLTWASRIVTRTEHLL
jgi:tight adherence protein B